MKSHYSMMDELMASPDAPLAPAVIGHHLTMMYQGLHALERDPAPGVDDWRLVSDAVNLLETLVAMRVVADDTGLLADAVAGLAEAGQRHLQQGAPIRLSGPAIQAVRAVLEDYAAVIRQLPARTMVRCHRATEKRIAGICRGRKLPHDVVVVNL
jgi:hypothetical protein